MTLVTQLLSESLTLTESSAQTDGTNHLAIQPTTESLSATKLYLVHPAKESLPAAEGFISGDELVSLLELTQDEEQDANRWVGEVFYKDKPVTIKSLRLMAGMSQLQLARRMNTSQSHVSRIERGTENISWDVALKLKSSLSIDMNKLEEALENQRVR